MLSRNKLPSTRAKRTPSNLRKKKRKAKSAQMTRLLNERDVEAPPEKPPSHQSQREIFPVNSQQPIVARTHQRAQLFASITFPPKL